MSNYIQSVMSETHALLLFDQLVYDHVLPRNSVPVVDNTVSFVLDSDGCVVMDSTIVTVLSVKELDHEQVKQESKSRSVQSPSWATERNSPNRNPYGPSTWFPY